MIFDNIRRKLNQYNSIVLISTILGEIFIFLLGGTIHLIFAMFIPIITSLFNLLLLNPNIKLFFNSKSNCCNDYNNDNCKNNCNHQIKVETTPIVEGHRLYYNFIRPHDALDGMTPSEKAGITIEGDNKWLTLMHKAIKHKQSKGEHH